MSYSIPNAKYYSNQDIEIPLSDLIIQKCDSIIDELYDAIEFTKRIRGFFEELREDSDLRRKVRSTGNGEGEFIPIEFYFGSRGDNEYVQFESIDELLDCLNGFNKGGWDDMDDVNEWMDLFEESEDLENTRSDEDSDSS